MSCINKNENQNMNPKFKNMTKFTLVGHIGNIEGCLSKIEREYTQIIHGLAFSVFVSKPGFTAYSNQQHPLTVDFENEIRTIVRDLCADSAEKNPFTETEIDSEIKKCIDNVKDLIIQKYSEWKSPDVKDRHGNVIQPGCSIGISLDKYRIYLREMLYHNKQQEQILKKSLVFNGNHYQNYEEMRKTLMDEIEEIYDELLLL